ncbi:ATP-binding cassette domain-containing protein [Mesomycoplasma ovipneumoniae]|uniref:ATP-binding cassette domain-containing protein n=1 Tax=Mesomycoplasma ovipneumoniae TaxID=29562 RepID=A0AAW6Q7U1_9BACT|nr:ATP-binding cassette domain-containing protein [Mesomycoplasma ovipneumoniae]MDF9627965.1 ATP-binding cassette domain-containing protein [Mesomycoplasma ovipneumoniae]MDO4157998.1 ATP-binding cassette domain-containing protein [Mesomycoplasma ovipneumoniae]MDO4158157.1 ATP-binding cassette domain-containing protein [Mesomycoplasma ovipneumoniae]MDO6821840.1 ATP-binding cassette domain-containing protein [Mesomycoplasma ovipneumoniae]MDO6829863.1 ATP-binding cassette domain-containing protei
MIKIENLSKKFNNKTIFNSINLEIPSNKITFIVGKSGIGKTTLINLIAGFTKKDSGKISFFKNGNEIENPLVDVVFQDFNLIESLSIKNNILIANHILNRYVENNQIEDEASAININSQKLNRLVKNLSGGEKQRAAFLRSSSRNADFILLDEPTGNLDKENSIALLDLLVEISQNKTVLVVSHNLELAKKYADQIIYVEKENIQSIENRDKPQQNLQKSANNFLTNSENKVYKKPSFYQKAKVALLLSFADFRSKITTFILVLVSFLAMIFGVVLFVNLNISAKNINFDNVVQYNLDTLGVSEKRFASLHINELEKLKKENPKIEKIIPIYSHLRFFKFSYDDKKISTGEIFPVDESDFFKNRFADIIKSQKFNNNFISNQDEVILPEKIINQLKIQNPIGKKIKISYSKYFEELKIVGVIEEKSFDQPKFSLIHTNKLKTTFEKGYGETFENFHDFKILPDNFYSLDFSGLVGGGQIIFDPPTISKYFYQNSSQANSINLTQGNLPQAFDEIAVSSSITDKIGKLIEINTTFDSHYIFKVVGIFDADKTTNNASEVSGNVVIFNSEAKNFFSQAHPKEFLVFFNHENLYNNIQDFLDKYSKSGVKRYYSTSGGIDELRHHLFATQFTSIAIIFASIIVLGITLLIFISVYAVNLSNFKKKSIAVLKSLGGKTLEIFMYHWLNLIIISVFVFFVGIILSTLIVPEIYKIVLNQNLFQPDYSQITVIFVLTWLISFVSMSFIYLLISYKTYRKDVATLLR